MSLEQIRGFLEASGEIEFVGKNRKEVYNWVGQTLVGQQYHILLKEEKGLLRIYLARLEPCAADATDRAVLGHGNH